MSKNKQQVDLARETINVFLEHGEDLSEKRHVVHYFYGGNHRALSDALRELGYEVRPTVNDDGVVAERYDAIDEEWRTVTLMHLCDLADSYGVEYDGWEAAMTQQQPTGLRAQHDADEENPQKPGLLARIFGKKS